MGEGGFGGVVFGGALDVVGDDEVGLGMKVNGGVVAVGDAVMEGVGDEAGLLVGAEAEGLEEGAGYGEAQVEAVECAVNEVAGRGAKELAGGQLRTYIEEVSTRQLVAAG